MYNYKQQNLVRNSLSNTILLIFAILNRANDTICNISTLNHKYYNSSFLQEDYKLLIISLTLIQKLDFQ